MVRARRKLDTSIFGEGLEDELSRAVRPPTRILLDDDENLTP